ncbi:TetR/AcrR family transcriptional regulator [Myxococcus qinghaiensis]|uniref:TetR/AcrR family transcriptional regulator n=1 Tax=Myxococcus qinghaiensis TaxID=2906758 RepID=UPI0020A76DCB|nr:TetR/AcrR family transcriptional regulator [Myxococcus qinghaiensis]MCP3162720.1 TetR/AcrR family transcriptional regulator [Myxococcus qinghaiensis]
MKPKTAAAQVGRPRGFDVDEALDRALRLFWRQGYEGTSLSDLTEELGINRPSLYAAFGNKESLFRKALDKYVERHLVLYHQAFALPTARAAVEHLLLGLADAQTLPRGPRGCITVQGALVSGADAVPIQKELAARRAAGEKALRDRLEQGQREGDVPAHVDCADLARYFTTVTQGMSVQAATGASREELRRVARTALFAWPA